MQGSPLLKKIFPPFFTFLTLLYFLPEVGTLLWASDSEGKTFPFPEINGWRQSAPIQGFSAENLYEYINGAADLYLNYDFQDLKVAEYRNAEKASVTVEIYRHRTPVHAFGIYSQERLQNGIFLDIGAQGYSEKGFLNFLTGKHYVKISSYKTGAKDEKVLLTFARKVAEKIGEKKSLPSILSSFPEEGRKINSEKFIAKNFLGYSFFHSGFTAEYDLSGKKFTLFVMPGANEKDCKNMIQQYLQHTGNLPKKISEGRYTIPDPYHGEMDFTWKGKYIWGVLNLPEPTIRSKYLKLFGERLQKKM